MQPACRFTCLAFLVSSAVFILATGAAGQSKIQSYDTGIVRGTVQIRLENGGREVPHWGREVLFEADRGARTRTHPPHTEAARLLGSLATGAWLPSADPDMFIFPLGRSSHTGAIARKPASVVSPHAPKA